MTDAVTDRADVSVVVPCYRCSATIRETVQSVAGQSLRPRELILVDDASPDDTPQTLRALVRSTGEDWVHVVTLDRNRGPGEARNAGWDKATSGYIAFLDADDRWHPGKVELQYRWMLDHPAVVLSGHRWQLQRFEGAATGQKPGPLPARQVSPRALLASNAFCTSSIMLRRDAPFRFSPGRRYCEDYELWLSIVLRGHQAWLLDVPLVRMAKAIYGASGLSGQLWRMERGELDALRFARREKLIGLATFAFAAGWSLLKFGRRLAVTSLQRAIQGSRSDGQ
jgi:glycosyltransferase involved in cell wall biosynthesis